jgi:hypothetical protein
MRKLFTFAYLLIITALVSACAPELEIEGKVEETSGSNIALGAATLQLNKTDVRLVQSEKPVVAFSFTKAEGTAAVQNFKAGQIFNIQSEDLRYVAQVKTEIKVSEPYVTTSEKSCRHFGYCFHCWMGSCKYRFSSMCSGTQKIEVNRTDTTSIYEVDLFDGGMQLVKFVSNPLVTVQDDELRELGACK